jgi:hypothetical protein
MYQGYANATRALTCRYTRRMLTATCQRAIVQIVQRADQKSALPHSTFG